MSQDTAARAVKPAAVKPLLPGMSRLLYVAAVLVLLAGFQLFVFTDHTASYFAWTIRNPLAAAFLGAGYWASVAFEALAARQRIWANARIAVPTVLVFTLLTLVATLLHLGLFHLGGQFATSTRLVTWAWIAIYTVVPLLMLIILAVQLRTPGGDPPRSAPLPGWVYGLLAVPGGRAAGPGRGAVRGAGPGRRVVALEADPAARPGDRGLADRLRGGRRARTGRAGRAPPAPGLVQLGPARRAAVHRAGPVPGPVRVVVRRRA